MVRSEGEEEMHKRMRYLSILLWLFWTGLLSTILITLRYILRTPKPLQSVLPGEAYLYKWTHGHIYYHVHGKQEAPPIVLLHTPEIAASSYAMRRLMDDLAQHYRVYALDLLGFGQSDHPAITYSAEMYVQLYRDFLSQVVGQPTTLLACGLSCNYSIATAALEPALCERLILLSPTSLFSERATRLPFASVFQWPFVGLVIYAMLTRRPILRAVIARQHGCKPASISDMALDHYVAVAHQLGAQHAPLAWLAGRLQLDVSSCLEQLPQPILILWGVHALNERSSLAYQYNISAQTQIALIHDAGISIQEEQPEAVIATIVSWLSASRGGVPACGHKAIPGAEQSLVGEEQQDTTVVTEQHEQQATVNDVGVDTQPTTAAAAIEAYCVKCKQKRPMQSPKEVITKSGRHALEDTCPACGTKLFRFVASKEK
jgi:pimeloyl-ACP methyl ester carboxylesterase